MAKKYIFISFLLFICFKSFAEDFTSFLGIPFGTDRKKTELTMAIEKNWKFYESFDHTTMWYGNLYAGKPVVCLSTGYDNNYFSSAYIEFIDTKDAEEVFTALISKYNLKLKKPKNKKDKTKSYITENGFYLFKLYSNNKEISIFCYKDFPKKEPIQKDYLLNENDL